MELSLLSLKAAPYSRPSSTFQQADLIKMKLSSLLIPFVSAFLSLDPEITTLEPQPETARLSTTLPTIAEAEVIAFLPTLMPTTTEETTAATTTTLYNNDGIVGLKFAGGKSGKKSKKPKKSGKKKASKEACCRLGKYNENSR